MRLTALIIPLMLAGCNQRDQTFTLYRNSSVDRNLRIHFATFNANESPGGYNMTNCQMAARILNANIAALAKAEARATPPALGFWCEPGSYRQKGLVPPNFDAAFPTSV
jgi:hypothetical protein